MKGLKEFVIGYIACALWSTVDESVYLDGEGPDDALDKRFSIDDIDAKSLLAEVEDCAAFIENAREALDDADKLGYSMDSAGHDFWLTRNGHGAGFWDREVLQPDLGDYLTEVCKPYGESYLYEGDDGKLYF